LLGDGALCATFFHVNLPAVLRLPSPRNQGADVRRSVPKFGGIGFALIAEGLPVPAETHLGAAWRHGTDALAGLGITYDGDRDGDGITDRAEHTVVASPLSLDTDGDGLTAVGDTDGDGYGDGTEAAQTDLP
jgi:Bacterial TSP3 repeat